MTFLSLCVMFIVFGFLVFLFFPFILLYIFECADTSKTTRDFLVKMGLLDE